MVRSTAQGTWFTSAGVGDGPPFHLARPWPQNSFCSQSPRLGRSATNLSPGSHHSPSGPGHTICWASLASSCVKSRSQGSWITNPGQSRRAGPASGPTGQLSRAEVSKSYSTQAVGKNHVRQYGRFPQCLPPRQRFSTSLGLEAGRSWPGRTGRRSPFRGRTLGHHAPAPQTKVPVVEFHAAPGIGPVSLPWRREWRPPPPVHSADHSEGPSCSTAQSSFTAFCRSFPR